MFKQLNIEHHFRPENRSYDITHKTNWNIFAKNKLADLHPAKKCLFWRAYNDFKEEHYKSHHIRDEAMKMLSLPYTVKQLAITFNRSEAHLSEILGNLKKEGKVQYYKTNNAGFWIRKDANKIIISEIKHKYLKTLNKSKTTAKELSLLFKRNERSCRNRLAELRLLGLVEKNEDKSWSLKDTNCEVIVK